MPPEIDGAIDWSAPWLRGWHGQALDHAWRGGEALPAALNGHGSAQALPVQFVPQCTAMWRIAVTSANGGLVTPATGLPAGYANKAPYDVALNVVTDAGVVTPAPCAAANLQNVAGATCDFKGTASPTQGLLLTRSFEQAPSTITVSAPAYAGQDVLISGTYQDTLTVTVSPAS